MKYQSDNVFQKIINGEFPADNKIYEDNEIIALNDINPVAEVHFLVIPKAPIGSVKDLTEDHGTLLAHMFETAKNLASQKGLHGYKCVFNVDLEGGQIIPHLHLHVIGGVINKLP